MQFRAVKGMNDILPGQIESWHRLEQAFIKTAQLHGYEEVRTPLVEPTGLFTRSIGEVTDVVQKEMYTFDRHKDSLTLRPEGTASCVRAYIQHSVQAKEPVSRWYYLGPMYRAERPQRGRYREFYQAGCEIYGDPGPACDAELISMLTSLFKELGIGQLKVLINSLGGHDSRAAYRERLAKFLAPKKSELSELSQARLEQNPLRILDSKHPADIELTRDAPSTLEALTADDQAHWAELQAQLDTLGVEYQVDTGLVRGLDYYTRTLFEIQSDAGSLGSQNTLAGGGRYDGLVKSLGGPDVPGIGFAMGLERLLLAIGDQTTPQHKLCYLAPVGEQAVRTGLTLARDLRALGVRVELDGRKNSLKSKLRRANTMNAELCAVFGESELERGVIQLKNFKLHNQSDLPLGEAATTIARQLASESNS